MTTLEPSFFLDRSPKPDDAGALAAVGPSAEAWTALRARLAAAHGPLALVALRR